MKAPFTSFLKENERFGAGGDGGGTELLNTTFPYHLTDPSRRVVLFFESFR
jgi:hypothetical protein